MKQKKARINQRPVQSIVSFRSRQLLNNPLPWKLTP